jgi:hypothetical protein
MCAFRGNGALLWVSFATRDHFGAPAESPPLVKRHQKIRDTSCATALKNKSTIYQIVNDL